MCGPDAKLLRAHRHPFVVGDDNGQVSPQFEGSRETNRIERTEVRRVKLTSGIQDPVVDSNEIEPLQHAPARTSRCRPRHEPSRQCRRLPVRQPEAPELAVPVDHDLQVSCRGLGFRFQHQESLAVWGDVIGACVILDVAERVSPFEQPARLSVLEC